MKSVILKLYKVIEHIPMGVYVLLWGISWMGPTFWWCPAVITLACYVLIYGMREEGAMDADRSVLAFIIIIIVLLAWLLYIAAFATGLWVE